MIALTPQSYKLYPHAVFSGRVNTSDLFSKRILAERLVAVWTLGSGTEHVVGEWTPIGKMV